jgi:hypothetical protein
MQKRGKYRKHKVSVHGGLITVKDWMRNNSRKFEHINGVPTSEQIGKVLIGEGYSRNESSDMVIYNK